jgi:hypothetical protein
LYAPQAIEMVGITMIILSNGAWLDSVCELF